MYNNGHSKPIVTDSLITSLFLFVGSKHRGATDFQIPVLTSLLADSAISICYSSSSLALHMRIAVALLGLEWSLRRLGFQLFTRFAIHNAVNAIACTSIRGKQR